MNNAEQIGIWYDDQGDMLTVTWEHKFGSYIDSDDKRVLVRVDTEGNVIGFLVHGFSALKDKSLVVRHGLDWWNQLGKDRRGSRPRCVLLTDGNRGEVARRLTQIVNCSGVVVSPDDCWMPYGKPVKTDDVWDKTPALEAELDKTGNLLPPDIRSELQSWWLAVRGRGRGAKTPTWDIASTCSIDGKPGLLLVEAKAHLQEIREEDKCGAATENRQRIGQSIDEANRNLASLTGNPWSLSRDSHYQLANRFAWSWKLTSLGVPVVLVYLGFLNAEDMTDQGPLIRSLDDWTQAVHHYGEGGVDNSCWDKRLNVGGTTFLPLIRAYNQPFNP